MDKREKAERVDGRINGFIIECLFSKYFEEKVEVAVKEEEAIVGIASSLRSSQ